MRRTSIRTAIIAGAVITAGAFIGSVPAIAEMIQGQITQINQENKTVTVQPQDRQAFPRDVEIKVQDNVFETNQQVRSIDELSVGDQITLEADKSFFGRTWSAQSILAVQNQGAQSGGAIEGEIAQPDDLTQDQGLGQEQPSALGGIGAQSETPQTREAGTLGDMTQAPGTPSEAMVYGRVVSTDPSNNKITVTDYATGQDREFTVVDSAALQSVRIGEEVMLQSDAAAAAEAGGAASIAGAGLGEASRSASEGLASDQAAAQPQNFEEALSGGTSSAQGTMTQEQAVSSGAVVTGESFQDSREIQPGMAQRNASPLVSEPESASRIGAATPDQPQAAR